MSFDTSLKTFLIIIIGMFSTILFLGCETSEFAKKVEYFNQSKPIIEIIDKEEFRTILVNQDHILIDIRTPEEYNSGHLNDAINIDYYSEMFREELNKLDKNMTYLIYCRSGLRTTQSLEIFKELEFQKVYALKNGIIYY